MASHKEVKVVRTKLNRAVLAVLTEAGYVGEVKEDGAHLGVVLKRPGFESLRRISKPGRRLYIAADRIPLIRSGRGVLILSTNKGVMTSRKARQDRVGGEILCEVY
jgi:small subunit ribosomal protein S8